MEFPESVTVYKDNKCYDCRLQLLGVSGGKQLLYIAEDGSVIKKETLARYKERLKRRKPGSSGYAIKA